jgi:hypothetical protein
LHHSVNSTRILRYFCLLISCFFLGWT